MFIKKKKMDLTDWRLGRKRQSCWRSFLMAKVPAVVVDALLNNPEQLSPRFPKMIQQNYFSRSVLE